VNVPIVVPLIETFAPIKGSLDEPSTTTPETSDCENDENETKETIKKKYKI